VTITIDELKSRADQQGLKYFVAPDRPALMMGFGGVAGSYQVIMLVELDGRFLQFRTVGYDKCPSEHPHIEAVLRVIGALDYKYRVTKFGWDPNDGEIVGYADLWLEDAKLTQQQFAMMLGSFIPAIDQGHARISKTMESGVDPEGSGRKGAILPTDTGGPGPRPTFDLPTV
jgi:hypothetical protein